MDLNRRDFGKLALAAAAAPAGTMLAAKPNSNFDGVQIGTITYSYRDEPNGAANMAEPLLKMIVDSGISAIELMPPAAEAFAGSPAPVGRGGGGGRGGSGGRGPGGGGGRGGSGGRGGGGGRQQMTPEQQEAMAKQAALLKDWRLSVSMSKFEDFRRMYNDAGVSIYCHKLFPSPNMSDEEFDYFFKVAAALGAKQISLELSEASAFTQKLGDTALKHGMVAAYHYHTAATITSWDAVLAQSKGNAVNLDCGHYYAGTGLSPIPAIEKLHDRIASVHLKDRTPTVKGPDGRTVTEAANLPWGQGSTPIAEILQTMRKNKYKFPASIELEYQVPQDSNAVIEVKKCMEYCKKALA
jgi:sugar phosphate isomerase/epimerase